MEQTLTNWAGNVTFRPARVHRPATVTEVRKLVAGSRALRALGTGHSFNTLADTPGDLVRLDALPRVCEVDTAARTATLSGALRFAEFTPDLDAAGLALHNLGSLPHISLAGACATGTHGSGTGNPCIASAVREVEFVAADGDLVTLARGEAGFDGAVVSLGALGPVTRLTLDLVPAFTMQQWVREDLPSGAVAAELNGILRLAYSVSLFTTWRHDRVEQVWLKHRVGDDGPLGAAPEVLGAPLADGPRHPIPGMPAGFCTEQDGVPGPWHARLPHFRAEFTPSSGEELQSEYLVDRDDAAAAFAALDAVRARFAPAVQIGEIRAVAADAQWLSPAHGRDSVAFHFTWVPDADAVAPALRAVEATLAPFAARPHWGKVFGHGRAELAALHPRLEDFARLRAAYDPRGVFTGPFLAEHLG